MPEKLIQLEGLRHTLEQLDKIEFAFKGQYVQALFNACANELASRVRAATPRGETGNLQRAVEAKRGTRTNFFSSWIVWMRLKVAPHIHLVEFGTKPHTIKAKAAKVLQFGDRFARGVQHPGAKKEPYFAPTVKAHLPRIAYRLEAGCKRILENAIKASSAP